MQMTNAIIAVVIYLVFVAVVGRWCRKNKIARALAFRVGVAACLLLAMVALVAVSLFAGKMILINDDLLVTVVCIIAIALLGGLRCRDHIPKEHQKSDTGV